ncbi:MAG: TolC family protein [Planctomycetota bacterium]
MFHPRRPHLLALLPFLLVLASCWVPPRQWGLNEEGRRPVPPPPRWSGRPPYRAAGAEDRGTEPGRTELPDPLNLREAFLLALRNNKDVLVTDLRKEADRERIEGQKGEFDVTTFARIYRRRSTIPAVGVRTEFAGTVLEGTDQSEGFTEAGLRQRLITGTDVEVAAANNYQRDLDDGGVIDPAYNPHVRLSLSQDLLRDAGVSINRTFVSTAENDYRISSEQLRQSAIETLFEVESAYWELYFALEDLQVRQRRLENAQKLVEVARAQADVGISPPLDITRASSNAAAQKSAILATRDRIRRLRHRLLRAMGVIRDELVNPQFALADSPRQLPFTTSAAEAVSVALEHRPDIQQALLRIDSRRLLSHYFRNQRLPDLELFGDYLLEGLGDDLSDGIDAMEDGSFNTWTVGLRFEFPFPNRSARSDYRVARLQKQQALWQWRDTYERVVQGVGDALSGLRAAEERIETAREARRLAQEVLRAEEKSFNLGRSNSLDVLDAQESLAAAERDEARAMADYATALANLFRVQGNLLERKGVEAPRP